jgi:hypothetical protein
MLTTKACANFLVTFYFGECTESKWSYLTLVQTIGAAIHDMRNYSGWHWIGIRRNGKTIAEIERDQFGLHVTVKGTPLNPQWCLRRYAEFLASKTPDCLQVEV